MSGETVRLRLRETPGASVRVTGLTPDAVAALTEAEIARLPAWLGREACRVGDLFQVSGGGVPTLHVQGALARVDGLGEGMADGTLVIEGDAGARVGASMQGGTIEVRGSVGRDAGLAMSGGRLHVRGGAGERLGANAPGEGAGMRGGEILVEGAVGAECGARMRRGLIVVRGAVGSDAGRDLIAGTLVAFGTVADDAASGNRRGTLVAAGGIIVPAGYRYACTYTPPHLLVTFRHLQRTGFAVDESIARGRYARYCGDAGRPGKGEMLVLERAGAGARP